MRKGVLNLQPRTDHRPLHELSIACAIVETSATSLPAGSRVLRLRVQIGDLAGVVEDSLRFCFELATEGTQLQGCILEIERIPVVLFCGLCQMTFQPEQPQRLICPHCQTPSADLRSGRELLIHSLEVSDESPDPGAA